MSYPTSKKPEQEQTEPPDSRRGNCESCLNLELECCKTDPQI